jgi:hypothetical protein
MLKSQQKTKRDVGKQIKFPKGYVGFRRNDHTTRRRQTVGEKLNPRHRSWRTTNWFNHLERQDQSKFAISVIHTRQKQGEQDWERKGDRMIKSECKILR